MLSPVQKARCQGVSEGVTPEVGQRRMLRHANGDVDVITLESVVPSTHGEHAYMVNGNILYCSPVAAPAATVRAAA